MINENMKRDEVRRAGDCHAADACLPPNHPGIYRNPIEIWFDNPELLAKYGVDDVRRLTSWAKAKAPLDPRVDAPLPDWAVDVLRLGRIGYKGRIRIVMTHAEDILRYRMIRHNMKEVK